MTGLSGKRTRLDRLLFALFIASRRGRGGRLLLGRKSRISNAYSQNRGYSKCNDSHGPLPACSSFSLDVIEGFDHDNSAHRPKLPRKAPLFRPAYLKASLLKVKTISYHISYHYLAIAEVTPRRICHLAAAATSALSEASFA